VSHREFCRGINSLFAQTHQDFELLVYHDGPLLDTSVAMPVPIICTEQRHNDWGHSLRDYGIRQATGDYIVHFNPDNILYPNALAEITAAIERPGWIIDPVTGRVADTNNIIIFSILMRGMQRLGHYLMRDRKRADIAVLMTGNPPVRCYVDVLQFVMRRDLWLAEGGWYDKTHDADGMMYPKFAQKYGYRAINDVLGEHY
jgi:hypothetical protein